MCTALTRHASHSYFGRNLDLEFHYQECVCTIPRNMVLNFRKEEQLANHYAFIGVATIMKDTPLFYDAANEHGLAIAGLNFPNNAYYGEIKEQSDVVNLAPFELIPYIMAKYQTVKEVKDFLQHVNVFDEPFMEGVPNTPLHYIISDRKESIVVEFMKDGMHVYANPTGCLTNNPSFDMHMVNRMNYQNLSVNQPEGDAYCVGLGAYGLPGDASSMSRFVRVDFLNQHAVSDGNIQHDITQFFHILHGVEMVKGCVKTKDGKDDYTVYTSCIDLDEGIYYYTTYTDMNLHRVSMYDTDLDASKYQYVMLEC